MNDHHLVLLPTLDSPRGKIQAHTLVDTGGTGIAFMNESYARQHLFPLYRLSNPRTLTVVDGRPIAGGTITHYTWTTMKIGSHYEELPLLLTSLGHYPIILGVKWTRLHGVKLDMHRNAVCFNSEYCLKNCLPLEAPITVTGLPAESPDDSDSGYESGPDLTSPSCDSPSVAKVTFSNSLPQASTTQRPGKPAHSTLVVTRHLDRAPAAPVARKVQETHHAALPSVPQQPLIPANQPAEFMNVAMIGSAPFDRLTKNRDMQIFAISLRDIEKALESKVEVDPRTLVPKEFHSDPEFMKAFSKQDADVLPPRRSYDHKIELEPGKRPGYGPLYGMSQNELLVLQKYLKEHLTKGFIRVSSSEAASPVLFARKPGGGLRFCVDYRGLNAITRKNRYPIPLIQETLRQMTAAKYFSKFDVIAAFNKLRIAAGDEWKTAFRTRYGLFEYLVMPFGLTNAPSSFQSYINDVLRPYLDLFCTAYLDDVIVYSNSLKEHKEHVRLVVTALGNAGLQLDIKKCEFFKTEVLFLGLLVSTNGVRMDPKKVAAIVEWKTPSNLHDVQEFIGFANFYRRFIQDFSEICKPLTALNKKDVTFTWSDECEAAFRRLKHAFTTAPVLAHFDPVKKIHLEVDSSDWVSGGTLSQIGSDNLLHPVAFFSKKHSLTECNYDIYDKELLAIIRALEEWRPECEGAEFPITILTDHKNLEYFTTKKLLSRRQARWAEFLSRFSYEFKYRPGRLNGKADALTRRSQDTPTGGDSRIRQQERVLIDPKLINLSPAVLEDPEDADDEDVGPPSLEELFARGYDSDPFYKDVMDKIRNGTRQSKGISLSECTIDPEGRLRFRGQLYVPDYGPLKLRILQLCHDSTITGHPGRAKTFSLLRRTYYWPGDYADVRKYVKFCQICRRTKASTHAPYGSLKALSVPNGRWKHISMDFIVGLPLSNGHDAILVVVDRLTKMKHLIPCNTTDDADKLARLFIVYVWKHHGLPETIVSDRGSLFTSEFWTRLCKRLGIMAALSTAFHPETDGQTERTNAMLEAILRAYTSYHQDDWNDWLPLAEFALNNQESETTKMTPFFANSAMHPRMGFEPLSDPLTADELDADRLAKAMDDILQIIQDEMIFAQAMMTAQANKHRIPAPAYRPGDKVWLSTRNLRTRRPSKKLDWKNIGPFEVVEAIGSHAYRLALPETMKIHDVFHVWLLNPASTDPFPGQSESNPPPVEIDGEEEWDVEAVLSSRVKYRKIYYTVRWKGDWEDTEEPAEMLTNAADKVAQYHAKYPGEPGPHNLKEWMQKDRRKRR